MNDADLQALATLFGRLGLAFRVVDARGRIRVADRGGEGGAVSDSASVELSGGLRLTVGAAPTAGGAVAAAPSNAEAAAPQPDGPEFEAVLNKEWRRARRERSALGLLMVDIDAFEALGAKFGAEVVERIVARVDSVVRRTMRRAADSVMRVGRGRFAVIMPNTAIQGAMDVAEIVRKAVVATDFNAIVPGGHPVTVSVGVAASVPLPGIVALSLVHGADAALAEAHRKGSNRVWMLQ